MSRFFVTSDQVDGDRIRLQGADAHHIRNVLRKGPGDTVVAVGPDGTEYTVRIEGIAPGEAGAIHGRVIARRQPDREPRIRVTIAQALIKGDKLDQVIRQGTELGAEAFWPFVAARSVVRLDADRARYRLERWQRVAEAAAKQSGRTHVPMVAAVRSLPDLVHAVREHVAAFGPGSVLLAWEGETRRGLFDALLARLGEPGQGGAGGCAGDSTRGRGEHLVLIVGPEGGFERDEAEALRQAGAVSVSLGPLIFRTETAGPAVLSMILYHAGDLGRAPAVQAGE